MKITFDFKKSQLPLEEGGSLHLVIGISPDYGKATLDKLELEYMVHHLITHFHNKEGVKHIMLDFIVGGYVKRHNMAREAGENAVTTEYETAAAGCGQAWIDENSAYIQRAVTEVEDALKQSVTVSFRLREWRECLSEFLTDATNQRAFELARTGFDNYMKNDPKFKQHIIEASSRFITVPEGTRLTQYIDNDKSGQLLEYIREEFAFFRGCAYLFPASLFVYPQLPEQTGSNGLFTAFAEKYQAEGLTGLAFLPTKIKTLIEPWAGKAPPSPEAYPRRTEAMYPLKLGSSKRSSTPVSSYDTITLALPVEARSTPTSPTSSAPSSPPGSPPAYSLPPNPMVSQFVTGVVKGFVESGVTPDETVLATVWRVINQGGITYTPSSSGELSQATSSQAPLPPGDVRGHSHLTLPM